MENSKNERMQSRLPTHRFEPLVEAQLELVWKWRNSDRVRKNMHDLNLIAWQEHLNWFSALRCDASRHFFIMWQNDRPIGILNFSKLDTSSPEWGCYLGETDVWPGSGIILELAALDYASHNPIFTHLDAQVLSFNNAANKLHQVFEYERIKSVPAGQRDGQSFDILHYRYPLDLWSQKRDKVLAKLPKNIKLVAASIQFGN